MALNEFGWFLDGSPGGLFADSAIVNPLGRYYFEATMTHGYDSGFDAAIVCFGIAGASALTVLTGGNLYNGAVQAQEAQLIGISGNTLGSGRGTGYPTQYPNGAQGGTNNVYAIAVNTTSCLMWSRDVTGGGNWVGDGVSPNPATDTSGFNFSTLISGRLYVFGGATQRNNTNYGSGTLNLGGSAFVGAVPSGYSAWSATDTLNSSDKSASLTLSGGNLSFSLAGAGDFLGVGQMVRSITSALRG